MFRLTYTKEFAAAHHLPGYDGKCKNVHGHNYVVEMEFCGSNTNANGMLLADGVTIDFELIKTKFDEVAPDHGDLNAWMSEPPSTENVARALFWRLRASGLPLCAITVKETARGWVRYEPNGDEKEMPLPQPNYAQGYDLT
jgi:6-pyruvoyltetrahydropterin/6-carboxytetrahydropterin synthase